VETEEEFMGKRQYKRKKQNKRTGMKTLKSSIVKVFSYKEFSSSLPFGDVQAGCLTFPEGNNTVVNMYCKRFTQLTRAIMEPYWSRWKPYLKLLKTYLRL
jgi:hypothetical protein